MKLSNLSHDLRVMFACLAGILCFVQSTTADEQQVLTFPHFANGAGYTTTWLFTGYGSGQSVIDFEVFDKSGHRLALATDEGISDTYHLPLNGYGSTSLRTSGGNGPLVTGWVRVTSASPVGAMEIFEAAIGMGLTSRASVLPSRSMRSATLLVPNPGTTGIALSTDAPNSLTFRLLDKNGGVVGVSNYSLAFNSQLALFVNQIPGLEDVSASGGSLEIGGAVPFYVTSLTFDGKSFATAPVLIGRSQPIGSRSVLLNQFNSTVQQSKDVGDQLLPPATEDVESFAAFLSQPRTGIIRLLPRQTYDGYLTTRGGGAYYSFARQTHEYGYGSDIELQLGYLSVGFAGADFGFMTSLGDVPIDDITLSHPSVQYLAAFTAPTTLSEARTQQQRSATGFSVAGYDYVNRLLATSPNTFVLRSICYNSSDVLVAFRVVRFDVDDSAVIIWKVLQTFSVPKL